MGVVATYDGMMPWRVCGHCAVTVGQTTGFQCVFLAFENDNRKR